MNEWVDGRKDEWIVGIKERKEGRKDEMIGGQMDGWKIWRAGSYWPRIHLISTSTRKNIIANQLRDEGKERKEERDS